jgi:hypothetical protein
MENECRKKRIPIFKATTEHRQVMRINVQPGVRASLEVQSNGGAHVRRPKTGEAAVNLGTWDHLSGEQTERIKQLLRNKREAFANNDSEVGNTSSAVFTIETSDRAPVTTGRGRTVPHAKRRFGRVPGVRGTNIRVLRRYRDWGQLIRGTFAVGRESAG